LNFFAFFCSVSELHITVLKTLVHWSFSNPPGLYIDYEWYKSALPHYVIKVMELL